MARQDGDRQQRRGRVDAQQNVGGALNALDTSLDKLDAKGYVFLGFTVKAPSPDREDWMMTIRAEIEGVRCIAFTSGYTLTECVYRGIKEFGDGKLQWKEDKYAYGS